MKKCIIIRKKVAANNLRLFLSFINSLKQFLFYQFYIYNGEIVLVNIMAILKPVFSDYDKKRL